MLKFLLRLKASWMIFWAYKPEDLSPKKAYTREPKSKIRKGRDPGVTDLRNIDIERFIGVADGVIKKCGLYIPEPRRTEICHAVAVDIYTQFVERMRPILCEAIDLGGGDTLEVTYNVYVGEWLDTVFTYHGSEPNCDC